MSRRKREKLITIEQVAELTGLAVKTIRARAAGTGELLRVKMGRRTMFSAAQVQEWINKRVQAARIEKSKREQAEKKEPEEEPEPANVIRIATWLHREEIKGEIARANRNIEISAPAEGTAALPLPSGSDAEPGEGIGRHAGK